MPQGVVLKGSLSGGLDHVVREVVSAVDAAAYVTPRDRDRTIMGHGGSAELAPKQPRKLELAHV